MSIRILSLNMPAGPDIDAKLSRKEITTVILHSSLFDEAPPDNRASIVTQVGSIVSLRQAGDKKKKMSLWRQKMRKQGRPVLLIWPKLFFP